MMHTIISPLDVFADNSSAPETVVKRAGSGFAEYVRDGNGLRLQRLFSTDPAMYLDKKYTPGEYLR